MILIDTSVWIEFFKQNPSFVIEITALLKKRMVITIEPVFAELVIGARNDKEKKGILSYWNVLPRIEFSSGSFLKAADFANRNFYHKSGIGLIDAIIIQAAKDNHCKIWTLDKRISKGLEKQYLY
jgi:predicted nucleic acid-binding protein